MDRATAKQHGITDGTVIRYSGRDSIPTEGSDVCVITRESGCFTVTVKEGRHAGKVVGRFGYATKFWAEKVESGMDVLANLLSLDGETPAKVVRIVTDQDMRDQVSTYLRESGESTDAVDAIVGDLQTQYGTVDIDTIDPTQFTDIIAFHLTPKPFDRTGDLFDRAVFLGYDVQAAGDVADCWENYRMVYDPCPFHPNHSVSTDRQGFAVDGCEACLIVAKSTGAGFVAPSVVCRVCHAAPVSTMLDLNGTFLGSISAPSNTQVPVCDRCLVNVLDTVEAGKDHTAVMVAWPYLSNFDMNTCFVVPEDPKHRYPSMDMHDRACKLMDLLSPEFHIHSAAYIVIDPAARETYDVSVDGITSEVRELSPSEAGRLQWEHFHTRGFRIMKRLHVELTPTPMRICVAESRVIFDVQPDGVTGPIYNRYSMHRIVKYTGVNCCERGSKDPGHLHMSAMASVISLHPSAPEIRISCKIGDVFVIDGVTYRLTNQRFGDPLLILV